MTQRSRFPWWLLIIGLLAAGRLWANMSRENPSQASRPATTAAPTASAQFKVYTSMQGGEAQASGACQRAIDISNGSQSMTDFKKNAPSIIQVCSTAYDDALKDATADSEVAHYMDENNAATLEEMVSATLIVEGDRAGANAATARAVALAKDVVAHSNEQHLVAAAKETIRELTGPVTPPTAATP